MKNNDEAVSPVIAIILMVAITVVLAGVLYMWVISLADTEGDVSIMKFTVEDGTNEDANVGCFFRIRAEKGVDINPKTHTFWVAEEGRSPVKLDSKFRDYSQDAMKRPEGGDRNASYRYDSAIKAGRWPDMPVEEDRERWNDGEYLAFDMPLEGTGISIVSGNNYEVTIKSPNNDIVARESFKYQAPW